MRLLAKSIPRGLAIERLDEAFFLPGHLRETHDAAVAILESTAVDQLRAFGLAPDLWEGRFKRVVSLAAGVHDLGKANDHFQGIVQGIPDRRGKLQGLRHEWVTLLILSEPDLSSWLGSALGAESADRLALDCAITGHHPAYNRPSPPQEALTGTGSEMLLYLQHPDFLLSLDVVAEAFGMGAPPILQNSSLSLLTGQAGAFSRLRRMSMTAEETWDNIGTQEKLFVAAVKACLVAADTAGSALPREIPASKKRSVWIGQAFAAIPTPDQIGEIVRLGLGGRELRTFQRVVADKAGDVTFVKAGCGTGKTLAAYNWARMRCPKRRLYFCYPTTGTATEGYRDYLFDPEMGQGRFGSDLFHGRADVDLDIILNVDRDIETDSAADDSDDTVARIESLNAWSTPIVSCTVDTVLGLMQNHRRGLCTWPALAGAAFVFDEIHAYDQRLFGALLRFLESVSGVPVLLMTASLPKSRLETIKNCLANRKIELSMPQRTEDLVALEDQPRYRWTGKTRTDDPMPDVLAEVRGGGKVLWVCNTVDRVMDAFARTELEELNPIVYHSRFRYEDRVRRHQEVIEAFRREGPALAICTQVAEMSLDLSATLLVTDLAPVPALIQRLGRLNRRAGPGDPVRPFIVVEPANAKGQPFYAPYDRETHGDWIVTSRKWLGRLPAESITQADLAAQWENLQADEVEPQPEFSAWLTGGPITTVKELRKGSPGVTVIMEQDRCDIQAGRKRLTEVTLPMPPPPTSMKWKSWGRHRGVPVAPKGTIVYDGKRGAKWGKGQR